MSRAYCAATRLVAGLTFVALAAVPVAAQRHYHVVSLGDFFTADLPNYNIASFLTRRGAIAGSAAVYDNGTYYASTRALFWQDQSTTLLGYFGLNANNASNSQSLALNDTGQVVGWSHVYDARHNDRGFGAFLWQNNVLTRLPDLGTDGNGYAYTQATAINDGGDVVGFSDSFNSSHVDTGPSAFLYRNGTLTDLGGFGVDASGYHYSYATGINNSGQICGYAESYNGLHND